MGRVSHIGTMGCRSRTRDVQAAGQRARRVRRTHPSLAMSVKPAPLADAWTAGGGYGNASSERGPLGRSSSGLRPDKMPRRSCGGQQGVRILL